MDVSEEEIKEMEEELLERGDEISGDIEHKFMMQCGFAKILVPDTPENAEFVEAFRDIVGEDYDRYRFSVSKKVEYPDGNKYWSLSFNYPSSDPTEGQSLRFKRPLYQELQNMLENRFEVECFVRTRLD